MSQSAPRNDYILHLRCLVCGETYDPGEVAYVCPHHGTEGILDVVYDYEAISQAISPGSLRANHDRTMWRYGPLLPVPSMPALKVGGTPLLDAPRVAAALGLHQVWIKDDGRLPTGSLKDRASAVALVKARQQGATVVTTASTGNAAAALGGLAAVVGQSNVIFVPSSAPQAKIAQLLCYGSQVLLVEGSYDDAFDLCRQAAETFGWYNRNTGYNPYMSEGKKTVSYEICEQLSWEAPDVILVSVGDGCIIGSVHKGLKDLNALGWIHKMPRLIGIQAEGSSFMAEAWENGEDVLTKPPVQVNTVADSIGAGLPRDRIKAMAAVRETGGAFIRLSDEEILRAVPQLARDSGVFAEPSAAAVYAGLRQAVEKGLISVDETSVLLVTGTGLKDVTGALRGVALDGIAARHIPARLEAVHPALQLSGGTA